MHTVHRSQHVYLFRVDFFLMGMVGSVLSRVVGRLFAERPQAVQQLQILLFAQRLHDALVDFDVSASDSEIHTVACSDVEMRHQF